MTSLGLIYDRLRWEEKELKRSIERRGHEAIMIDAKSLSLDCSREGVRESGEFGELVLQRCISHFRGLHITNYLEGKGMEVVNPFQVAFLCGNKLLTTMALQRAGIPNPKTYLCFTPEAALEAIEKLGYPAVMKPVVGSWGRMVVPIRDREAAKFFIEMRASMNGALDQIYYIQEMVKRPDRDIRCIVVGDRLVAAAYRYSPPGDWRTNVARGGKVERCPITKELEDLALKAGEAIGGGVLGIDLMESDRGLLVNEINSTVEFRGAAEIAEANIADAIIDYAIAKARR